RNAKLRSRLAVSLQERNGHAPLPGPPLTRDAVPLAFLPIDAIAPLPIDYLSQHGMPVQRFAYRALSDIGLGNPVIRYQIDHGERRPLSTLIAKWHEPDQGPSVAALLEALWQGGFAGDEALCLAEPLGPMPDVSILLA